MSEVGTAYGQALYSLAREEALGAQLLGELETLDTAFASEPQFLKLLAAPKLSKEERLKVVDESFRGRVHPYVLSFLKLLTERGHARRFSECVRAYREQYFADEGILVVRAISAAPLSESQAQRLTAVLTRRTGKTVRLEQTVDARCLGGVKLEYDGTLVDGTVAHRLSAIGDMLKNTVL